MPILHSMHDDGTRQPYAHDAYLPDRTRQVARDEGLAVAFMPSIRTHPELSRRFDPGGERTRRSLDLLIDAIDADEAAVRSGVLQPLEIWGVYLPRTAR